MDVEPDRVAGGRTEADRVGTGLRRIADEQRRRPPRIERVRLPLEIGRRQHALGRSADVRRRRGVLDLDLHDADRRRSDVARTVCVARRAPERLARADVVALDGAVGSRRLESAAFDHVGHAREAMRVGRHARPARKCRRDDQHLLVLQQRRPQRLARRRQLPGHGHRLILGAHGAPPFSTHGTRVDRARPAVVHPATGAASAGTTDMSARGRGASGERGRAAPATRCFSRRPRRVVAVQYVTKRVEFVRAASLASRPCTRGTCHPRT